MASLAYFVKGSRQMAFDIPSDAGPGADEPLSALWPALNWTHIDAASNWGDGSIVFFQGDKFRKLDLAGKKVLAKGSISKGWPGGWPKGWTKFDAVLMGGDGTANFFSGSSCARYNIHFGVFHKPTKISETFPALPNDWTSIDAAVNWGNGMAYLFRGKKYVAYDLHRNKRSGIRTTTTHWDTPVTWASVDAVVTIDSGSEAMGKHIEALASQFAVGFAYTIYEGKRQTKTGSGGTRLHGATPKKFWKYTVNTQQGIGSITKTLTAAGTLKALETQGLSLETKIRAYLPKDWKLGPGVKDITFRELMTHTSGFRVHRDSYGDLKEVIRKGIIPALKNYQYRNTNFTLMRILIPGLLGTKLGPGSLANAHLCALTYRKWMKDQVFDPAFVPNADCRFNSAEIAYLHGTAWAPGSPYVYEGDDDSMMIAGGGGWKLSVIELGRVLNACFEARVLTSGQRDALIGSSNKRGLGCFRRGGAEAMHNGAIIIDGKGYSNSYSRFPDGVTCVLMTNSRAMTPSPFGIIRSAHKVGFP